MRIYKQVTIKREYTDTVVDKTICDRCGKEFEYNTAAFETFDFELYFYRGSDYPEGGHKKGLYVDLCEDCIDWLFFNLLPNNGVKPNNLEEYW